MITVDTNLRVVFERKFLHTHGLDWIWDNWPRKKKHVHISLKQICSDVFKEMLHPTKSDAESDRFVEIWQYDKVAHQFTVNKVNVLFYRCKQRHATWHDFTVILHTTIKQPLRTNNNVMLSIHCRNWHVAFLGFVLSVFHPRILSWRFALNCGCEDRSLSDLIFYPFQHKTAIHWYCIFTTSDQSHWPKIKFKT